jgi:hypothetical protein
MLEKENILTEQKLDYAGARMEKSETSTAEGQYSRGNYHYLKTRALVSIKKYFNKV